LAVRKDAIAALNHTLYSPPDNPGAHH
jgi:hypothetical protein